MSKSVPAKWDASKMTSQKGKIAIVTGSNTGIGYVAARELARNGAHVILACRTESKGLDAERAIRKEIQGVAGAGTVEFRKLDVSSLVSVKAFADSFKQSYDRVDLLIQNAGVLLPEFTTTVDGIETQFATNHLGHFALTSHLLDLLKNSQQARVLAVSSTLHNGAKMEVNEIVTPKSKYSELFVYRKTKLYNILFVRELNRRLRAKNISNITVAAVHPGLVATNIQNEALEKSNFFKRFLVKIFNALFEQDADMGALTTLYAATASTVVSDDFFGPDGLLQAKGYPAYEKPHANAESAEYALALWNESERLAKIKFAI